MGSPTRSHRTQSRYRDDTSRRERDFRRGYTPPRNESRRHSRDRRATSPSPSPKRPRTELEPAPSSEKFVWKKKVEQLRKRGIRYTEEHERRRREDLQRELADAQVRRERRHEERAAWEAEQNAIAREREAQQNEGWHRQEASFHGKQHFLRQGIRIRDRRAAKVDQIAQYVRLDLRCDVGILNLDELLEEMDLAEVEKLLVGIEDELDYVADFSTEADNDVWNRAVRLEFWECVKTCVADHLAKLRAMGNSRVTDGVHSTVDEDVNALLSGKSISKLREMETEIQEKLKSTEDGYGEVDFWTATLDRIRKSIAIERLREMSTVLWKERESRYDKERKDNVVSESRRNESSTENDMMKQAANDTGSDEEDFADEVEVPQERPRQNTSGYAWNDKYRPRKPRYFNRVYAGYNWTKYNRTHYDHDNPPPKTVQGYKFNLFYPDLIDPTKTPIFTVKKTENPDVAIITFKAGPPYEDVAFKIVNRPWERSHRKGYKCSFDRGILHLWFHFQRYRYRR